MLIKLFDNGNFLSPSFIFHLALRFEMQLHGDAATLQFATALRSLSVFRLPMDLLVSSHFYKLLKNRFSPLSFYMHAQNEQQQQQLQQKQQQH
jgi:hypothetical protein